MSVQVVQELVTKFGFLGSTKPLKDYNLSLGGSIKLLGGMTAALSASAGAFAWWADRVLGGVDSLGALSRETGVAVGRIQELNFVAGQTQSTAGAMQSSLTALSRTIGQATMKGSEDFARLGISVRDANGQIKSADVVLNEVRGRFRALNLTMEQQRHFASALGIDASLLQMLNKTDAEMAGLTARARELGTLNKEQIEQAESYKQSLAGMRFALDSVRQLMAVGVAPEMRRMAESFTDLLAANKDWIVAGIRATVRVMSDLLDAFNRLLPVIAALTAGFTVWKIAAVGLGTVLGVVFSPIVLITGAILGLLLIIDDLIVAFRGGESVIASFFKDTFNIDIVDAMTVAFDGLKKYGIDPIINGLKSIWDMWTNIAGSIFSGGERIAKFFGFGGGGSDTPTIQMPAQETPIIQMPAQEAPSERLVDRIPIDAPGQSAGTQIDNRQVSQRVDVTVVSSDPQEAGRAVQDNLQRQLDNANIQLSPGGR